MTDGEPKTVVSASLQKIKSIKNPIKKKIIFYFIKPETSDSFVSHFNGHFAYLKTLDFYFNLCKFELSTIYNDMFEDIVCKQNELQAKNVKSMIRIYCL